MRRSLGRRDVDFAHFGRVLPGGENVTEQTTVFARRSGDLTVISVNVDEDAGAAPKFFPRGTNLTVLLDPDKAAARRFGTERFPETFLIDRSGRVQQMFYQAKWDGPAAAECLESL